MRSYAHPNIIGETFTLFQLCEIGPMTEDQNIAHKMYIFSR